MYTKLELKIDSSEPDTRIPDDEEVTEIIEDAFRDGGWNVSAAVLAEDTNDGDALIELARDLRSEHGENPEYDRALIELTNRFLRRTADEIHFTQAAIMADEEDIRTEKLSEAGANVVDALTRLYKLNDGDEAAVGEMMYEIDKAARLNAQT